jgi:hypothetical protein
VSRSREDSFVQATKAVRQTLAAWVPFGFIRGKGGEADSAYVLEILLFVNGETDAEDRGAVCEQSVRIS